MTPQRFFEIPLGPEPRIFTITLAGTTYRMRTAWNQAMNCWVLSIADADDVPIISSIPMVTGLDLLAQYLATLGLPGYLVAQTDYDTDAVPTYENLGTTGRLYFITTPSL